MTKEQEQVQKFMHLFKQEVLSTPTVPSDKVRELRARLILEEALETIKALGFSVVNLYTDVRFRKNLSLVDCYVPDLVGIADGIGDVHYVGYCGTAAACGIDMEPVFQEIHRSNMSKMWTEEDLRQVGTLYPTGIIERCGAGLYVVRVDGKVIKSPSYSPADIPTVLAKQGR